MMEAIDILFTASLWGAVLRIATPLIFGTLGALICERAGVLNLGIEGHHDARSHGRLDDRLPGR